MNFTGELHNVKLINFTIDSKELEGLIPNQLQPLLFDGKALISMVDVELKNMKVNIFPFFKFGYRHVAFRLLIDDRKFTGKTSRGIYFLRSFSSKRLMVLGDKLLTNYNLELAEISGKINQLVLSQNENRIECKIDASATVDVNHEVEIFDAVKRIDRAYFTEKGKVFYTEITREHWPIRRIECTEFLNTYFKSVDLRTAYKVDETIYYKWNNPEEI